MKVTCYNLYCEWCHDFVTVLAELVSITLDLRTDEYQFYSECPVCKKKIYNTRQTFN